VIQQAEGSIEPAQEIIEGSMEVDERKNYPKNDLRSFLKKV